MSDNPDNEHAYQRAARLLGRKLGLDWRTMPREQVEEYLRKIEIAAAQNNREEASVNEDSENRD